jgi:DNA-binding winged helix-turn-helix (wHTH) protein/tetratricopeptide (TPR) repeat protein
MLYHFAGLTLDDQSKILSAGKQSLVMTLKNHELLLYLLKNQGRVVSRDELIMHVWHGRTVTDNTVDQCILKLRKTLQSLGLNDAIESVYGHGIKFTPSVKTQEPIQSQEPYKTNHKRGFVFILLLALVTLVNISWNHFFKPSEDNFQSERSEPKPILMIVGEEHAQPEPITENDWQQGPDWVLVELFKYSDQVDLRLYGEKPPNLNQQSYLNSQWQQNPELNTVLVSIHQQDLQYTLRLTLTHPNQLQTSQDFTDENISLVIKQASQWLHQQMQLADTAAINELLPNNAYVTELYMRGLLAMKRGDIDKAAASFELCIAESPDFHLARLELAHIRNQQGRMEDALVLIKTLEAAQLLPAFDIEMTTLKSNSLDILGRGSEATSLLKQSIDRYAKSHPAALNDLRLVYAQRLQSSGELVQALQQLKVVETNLNTSKNPRIAATTYIAQASVLHDMGQNQEAEKFARAALTQYTESQDLIGVARSNSTLGRILIAQGNRQQAAQYMYKALSVARELNYTMGVGASINDMLPLLVTIGKLDEANQLNQEMQQIGEDIQFPRMQLAAMQHAFEIALKTGNETSLKQITKEHRQLALGINNQRALQQSTLMDFKLMLYSKQQPDEVQIQSLQTLINEAEIDPIKMEGELLYGQFQLNSVAPHHGVSLLEQTLQHSLSETMSDSATRAAQILADYWILNDKPQKALKVLHEIQLLNPHDYPQLLIQARAEHALGNHLKAIELAQKAQSAANQLWQSKDQAFVSTLIESNQSRAAQ